MPIPLEDQLQHGHISLNITRSVLALVHQIANVNPGMIRRRLNCSNSVPVHLRVGALPIAINMNVNILTTTFFEDFLCNLRQ